VGDRLRADLAAIQQVSQSLNTLSGEFSSISAVADVGGAAGDSGLASALSDFAHGWSDKRKQLISEMQDLSKLADQAVKGYTGTDATLAHDLAGGGKGA
jgi:hypothetical protein